MASVLVRSKMIIALERIIKGIEVWQHLGFSGKDFASEIVAHVLGIMRTIQKDLPERDLDLEINREMDFFYQISEVFSQGVFKDKSLSSIKGALEQLVAASGKNKELESSAEKLKAVEQELFVLRSDVATRTQRELDLRALLDQKTTAYQLLERRLQQQFERRESENHQHSLQLQQVVQNVQLTVGSAISATQDTAIIAGPYASALQAMSLMLEAMRKQNIVYQATVDGLGQTLQDTVQKFKDLSAVAAVPVVTPTPTPVAGSGSQVITRLKQEVSSLEQWLGNIHETQEGHEAIIRELNEKIKMDGQYLSMNLAEDEGATKQKIVRNKLLLAQYMDYVVTLVALAAPQRERMETLQGFMGAIRLLKAGPPEPSTVGLPEVPEFEIIDQVVHATESGGGQDEEELEADPKLLVNERYRKLVEIAERNKLTPAGVFVITMYESVVPSSLNIPVRKAPRTLAFASWKTKLSQSFGWTQPFMCLRSWTSEESGRYLVNVGTVPSRDGKSITIFRRTSNSVPWNPLSIFTAEEIQAFLESVEEKRLANKALAATFKKA